MRDHAGCLQQQQTLRGHREIHAAADDLLREPVVVAGRIIAEEAEMKAVFAGGRSMASAGIAAGAKENGFDVEAEADRFLRLRRRDSGGDECRDE
jgi:hypothetical protein